MDRGKGEIHGDERSCRRRPCWVVGINKSEVTFYVQKSSLSTLTPLLHLLAPLRPRPSHVGHVQDLVLESDLDTHNIGEKRSE